MHSTDLFLENFFGLLECGTDKEKLDLLSSKGKILATMLRHNELTVKDIPHLAGVSFRTCFQHLSFLEQIGVVEKSLDPLDRRRAIVRLNRENLSKIMPFPQMDA